MCAFAICCGIALLYIVKICKDIGSIKCWLTSSHTGNIGGATRLREFWEKERERGSHQPEAEETRRGYFTEKKIASHLAKHRQEL